MEKENIRETEKMKDIITMEDVKEIEDKPYSPEKYKKRTEQRIPTCNKCKKALIKYRFQVLGDDAKVDANGFYLCDPCFDWLEEQEKDETRVYFEYYGVRVPDYVEVV